MLDLFRCAMAAEPRSRLSGVVEAGETTLGQAIKDRNPIDATAVANKKLVLGTVELLHPGETREKSGRLFLAIVECADQQSIRQFLQEHVRNYCCVASVGWDFWLNRPRWTRSTSHLQAAFSELKTWLNEVHRGVDPNYLPRYLSEFAFRFNRGQTQMESCRTLLNIVCKPTASVTGRGLEQ